MKNLIIIGVGGVGRETALLVEDINEINITWNLLGFVDDNESIQNKVINDYKVLGKLDYLINYDKEVYVVCAIANYNIKKNIIEKLSKNKNIKFANIIHPSSSINKTVEIGKGCIIYQNVILTANIKIGDHVIISPKTGIGHDANVENYCSILWNVNISGNVNIQEGTLIGSGATIIQGLNIGRESIIGAGSVVIRDIEDNVTAVGNPSRIVKNKMVK